MEKPVEKSYFAEEHVERKPYHQLVETKDLRICFERKKHSLFQSLFSSLLFILFYLF